MKTSLAHNTPPHSQIKHAIDEATGERLLDMSQVKVDAACVMRVPANIAVRRQVLAFAIRDNRVHVACMNPDDPSTMQTLQRYLRLPVVPERAEPQSLKQAIARAYGDANSGVGGARWQSIDLRQQSIDMDDADTVALCNQLLHAAILHQASDIHIDPQSDSVRVRFRIDGQLEFYRELPSRAHAALISRLKVLSGMDIAEKRSPQDGGFAHRQTTNSRPIDVRTATLPTRHGERMTLRLLAMETESLTLEKLGMSPEHLEIFSSAIQKPHGLILLTGPTGSGKTTSLYAAIRRLINERSLNVLTVEDPIEYDIEGVAQTEVDAADKVGFNRVLRGLLRHDPDVIMIGEIRDEESADIAIKAALTGHLVFSTLHTNSAAGAITRLVDMGVERYLIASTLRLVVAQRLVRRLCQHCGQPEAMTIEQAKAMGVELEEGMQIHQPGGCHYCGDRGYSGRLGLFEMIDIDEDWAGLIGQGAQKNDLTAHMREKQVMSLVDDAAMKILSGQTSVNEAMTAVSAW